MFMGGRAFAYYYPVIDAYLRSIPDIESCDDHQACILAHGIKQQFESENLPHVRHLAPRVIELANFVTENSRRFGNDDEERRRVTDAWTALVRHLNAVTAP